MQRLSTLLATIVVALSAAYAPAAQAATAYMVSCEMTTSVTGRLAYVGTYNYAGQYFTRTFPSYCPFSVEVY